MCENKTILVCQCCERRLLDPQALEALAERDEVALVPDLCRAAAERDPLLRQIATAERPVVHGCHERAVRALFAFSGTPLPAGAEVVNLRQADTPPGGKPSGESNPAWYPVVDSERCSHCGQCQEFCLFGVYEKDEQGQVVVTHPEGCKNNCPACARICPEAAIIFPKAGEAPINGDQIEDEAALKGRIRVNVDEILGDDVYAALNARKKKRRSLLNRKKVEQALAERRRCSEEKR